MNKQIPFQQMEQTV